MNHDELRAYGAELAAKTPPLPDDAIATAARLFVAALPTSSPAAVAPHPPVDRCRPSSAGAA